MPIQKATRFLRRLNTPQDTQIALWLAVALLGLEAVLCALIIWRVPYTEIDWLAYMEQVEGFLRALVMALYIRSRVVPPWVLCLLCLSKRLHSIFLLRLFNDGLAMLVSYAAIWLLTEHRWRTSLVAFSAAVSIKMNVLLMAPPVLLIMLKGATLGEIGEGAAAGVALQLLLGAPFLLHSPGAYVSRAFELSRVFQHIWSVNLKFLPEGVFRSRRVALALLMGHLAMLWLFARNRWCRREGGVLPVVHACWQRTLVMPGYGSLLLARLPGCPRTGPKTRLRGGAAMLKSNGDAADAPGMGSPVRSPSRRAVGRPQKHAKAGAASAAEADAGLRADHILLLVFTGNFIGIVFARTLHYQFFAWYAQMLPFLLWQTELHWIVRLGLWAAVEVIWNIYPSTTVSSLSLLCCHLGILLALRYEPTKRRG